MTCLVKTFWRVCGVFTIDLTYNKFQYVYSLLLMATCVYNFITASQALCKLDQWCVVFSSTMTGMYTRVLASTTFFSRVAIMIQSKQHFLKYKATIKAFEQYSPTSPKTLKSYNIFSFIVVFLCLVIILPMNINRLYYLYYRETDSDNRLLIYYLFMYIQNLSMFCIETQFVVQCFIIYTKFREINDDLQKLKNENINYAKYPFLMSSSSTMWKDYKIALQCVRYDKDFYIPRFKSHPVANAVEILRIKHWITRQAVETLNNLFGIQMGLSVFLLWVMALFDIYYEIFHTSPTKLWVYCWLLQYSLRLFMIILVAHYTTKQARKSKSLIVDTNNQILDNSTNEELLLFMNQIRHHSIEFTAYDFFTLNTQVIKSAIAAGTTYLVILIQFHSYKKIQ